jgi:hypothetical protein
MYSKTLHRILLEHGIEHTYSSFRDDSGTWVRRFRFAHIPKYEIIGKTWVKNEEIDQLRALLNLYYGKSPI